MVADIALAQDGKLFWRVMMRGMEYVEEGLARYEAKAIETKHRALQALAKQLSSLEKPSYRWLNNMGSWKGAKRRNNPELLTNRLRGCSNI